jgi:hypothetical protein
MSKFKGTPGPWFSPDGKTIKQDFTKIGLSPAAGCTIGAVMGGSTSGPHFIEINEEVAANTKLIVAAPDLLECLSNMLDHFEGNIPLWLFEKSESAIAKATE